MAITKNKRTERMGKARGLKGVEIAILYPIIIEVCFFMKAWGSHFQKWKKDNETKEELISGKRIKRVINSSWRYTWWNRLLKQLKWTLISLCSELNSTNNIFLLQVQVFKSSMQNQMAEVQQKIIDGMIFRKERKLYITFRTHKLWIISNSCV